MKKHYILRPSLYPERSYGAAPCDPQGYQTLTATIRQAGIVACGASLASLRRYLGLVVVVTGLFASHADGQVLFEDTELLASDATSDAALGWSVSLSDNRLLVGAFGKSNLTGAAYIFDLTPTGWVESAKLVASDGQAGEKFGWDVAIDGDRAIISSRDDVQVPGSEVGSAYIFEKTPSGWVEQAKLLPSDGAVGDNFGTSVAIAGDRAIVGCLPLGGHDLIGRAYVFERGPTGWVQEAQLFQSGIHWNFGVSVDIYADRAVVGALSAVISPFSSTPGGAYVFRLGPSGWIEETILASGGGLSEAFGWSVDIHHNRVIVGAPSDQVLGPDSGSAYIFEFSEGDWNQTAKLLASDGHQDDQFGWRVSIYGVRAIVGTTADVTGGGLGSAYVFSSTPGWIEQAKLAASDGAPLDFFGWGVGISHSLAVVGSSGSDTGGTDAGAVYAYNIPMPSCTLRGGSLGTNPLDYACITLPTLGTTWKTKVSKSPILGTSVPLTFVAISNGGPTQGVAVGGFELLGLPPYALISISATGDHGIAVPVDSALLGVSVATQGARIEMNTSSVFVVLLNAQDIVLGM